MKIGLLFFLCPATYWENNYNKNLPSLYFEYVKREVEYVKREVEYIKRKVAESENQSFSKA